MPVISKAIVDLGTRIAQGLEMIGGTLDEYYGKHEPEVKEPSDVNFYDWDGRVAESYTADEFLALTEMPANPTREGWESRGWNWSFEDAQEYVGKYGKLEIGQMYNPLNVGPESVITIKIPEGGRTTVNFCWQQDVDNSVKVYFSDEEADHDHTYAGVDGVVKTFHTFPGPGEYTITILPEEGSGFGFGDGVYTNFLNENYANNHEAAYATYITNIIIGNSISSIGNYAFCPCCALQSLTISNSVISIGRYAFNNIYMLPFLILPDSITSIGDCAFSACYRLKSLIIPNAVTSIGEQAFMNCTSFRSLAIPNGVTFIGQYAFSTCHKLQSLTIPDSITSIGNSTFSACYALESLVIPDSVTSIEGYAFSTCYALESLAIPDLVISIEENAFSICYALQSLIIPNSIASIKKNAFKNCYAIKELTLLPETPPTLANINAFNYLPSDCVIYVPYSEDHSILEAYQTATNWSTFAEQMVEMDAPDSDDDEEEVPEEPSFE